MRQWGYSGMGLFRAATMNDEGNFTRMGFGGLGSR